MKKEKRIHVGFLAERMLRGFGVDLVVDRTAKELVKNGFKVTVFCINTDGTYENESYEVVQICSGLHHNPLKTDWSAYKALKRLNAEDDIDIWIAETYPFFLASKVMDKPVIVVDHGIVLTKGLNIIRRIIFVYIKLIQNYIYFPSASRIINISKFTQFLTPKLLRKKQSIIYNGADNYQYPLDSEITQFKKDNGFKDNEDIFLYVGRINSKNQPYKGTAELVEVFKNLKQKHRNIKLVMAGFGNEEDRKWLKKEGVIPFISADDKTLSLLYSIADCYVTASKWEGFNLPLVEAAHFNVPYVAYNAGAHKEVVDNKSGFLVDTKKDFIKSIEKIILDKERRLIMAKYAKENASRFLWKNAGKEYEKTIVETLESWKKDVEMKKITSKKYDEGVVDVITLNYNGKKYLKPLFDSLNNQTYESIRVTMVDNGSSDDSVEYVKKEFPWVNVIESKVNLFFSRGNNLAISKTNGEYVFFVNNDIIVQPDAIKNLVDTLEKKGKYNIASVAAKMLLYKNKQVFDSVGVVMMSNGSPFNRGIGQIDIGQYDQVSEIFGACFGAVLIRRNVYEKTVGPLDNSYFGYFEDVDWSYRARIFGYKSYFCPSAVVYHDHSGTSKKLGYEWKYYLIHRNFIKTIIKNFQFKRMIFKGGWKVLELINHLRKTKDKERRVSVLKILGNTVYMLPTLLLKRFFIQIKRCASDHECIKFNSDEYSFFDAVKYEPILTLDTLQAMFDRLDLIRGYGDSQVSEIASKINYLNCRKMLMKSDDWDNQVKLMLESMNGYIGGEYVKKFTEAIVYEKTWKK